MREDWEPDRLWERLARAVRDWMSPGDERERERDAQDPGLHVHVAVTLPLLILLAALARRIAS